jgi:hypothetical protein
MILTDRIYADMPVAVFVSIILLGTLVSIKAWWIRDQLWSRASAWASQVIIWSIITDTTFQWSSRYWPELYAHLDEFWPTAIMLKLGYVIGFSALLFTYAHPKGSGK